jgi:hypothetical protein
MSKAKDKAAGQQSPCIDPYNPACHDAISEALNLVTYHVDTARKSIDSDHPHSQKLETVKLHVDSAKKAAAKLRPRKGRSV